MNELHISIKYDNSKKGWYVKSNLIEEPEVGNDCEDFQEAMLSLVRLAIDLHDHVQYCGVIPDFREILSRPKNKKRAS